MIDETQPPWADADRRALPEAKQRRPPRTSRWVERAGSQDAAFTGEESWTPERRFGRVFERLALPGFTRAVRFDLLTALGAAGRYPLEADALHFVEDDARRRSPPSACSSPATGCCSSAARATSPTRPTCRSPRLTAAWRLGHAGRARRPDRGSAPGLAAALRIG